MSADTTSTSNQVTWGDIRTYSKTNMPNLEDIASKTDIKNPIKFSTTIQKGGASTYAKTRFDKEYSSGYFSPQPGVNSAAVPTSALLSGYFHGSYVASEKSDSERAADNYQYWYDNTVIWEFNNTSKNSNIFVYYKNGAFYNGEYYDVKVYYWMSTTDDAKSEEYYQVLSSGSIQVVNNRTADKNEKNKDFSQIHMEMYFYKSSGSVASKVTFADSSKGFKVINNINSVPADSAGEEFKGVLCQTDMDAAEGVWFKQGANNTSGVKSASNVFLSANTFIRRALSDADMHGSFYEYLNSNVHDNDNNIGNIYEYATQDGADNDSTLKTLLQAYAANTNYGFNLSTFKYTYSESSSEVPEEYLNAITHHELIFVGSISNVGSNTGSHILGNNPEYMSLWAEFYTTAGNHPFQMVYFTPHSRGGDLAYRGVDINYKYTIVDNSCTADTKSGDLSADHATAYGTYDILSATSIYNQVKSLLGTAYSVEGIYTDKSFSASSKIAAGSTVDLTDVDETYYVKLVPNYTVTTVADSHSTITKSSGNVKEGDSYTVTWKADDGYVISDVKVEATAASNAPSGTTTSNVTNTRITSSNITNGTITETGGTLVINEGDEKYGSSKAHRNYTITVTTTELLSKDVSSTYSYEIPLTFTLTKKDSGDSSVLLQGATYSLKALGKDSTDTSYSTKTSATATTNSSGKLTSTMTVEKNTAYTITSPVSYIVAPTQSNCSALYDLLWSTYVMSDTVIKTVGTTENDKEWNNFLAKKAERSSAKSSTK
jgi:hypothetical protein